MTNHKEAMVEDFLHQQRTLHRDEYIEVNDDMALNDLQEKVISMGGRQLSEYGLWVIPCQINQEFRVTSRILTKLGVFVVPMGLITHTNF